MDVLDASPRPGNNARESTVRSTGFCSTGVVSLEVVSVYVSLVEISVAGLVTVFSGIAAVSSMSCVRFSCG